eukprot:COSAG01_NODE_1142_length_11533_cov_9.907381_9_plen_159_part_00
MSRPFASGNVEGGTRPIRWSCAWRGPTAARSSGWLSRIDAGPCRWSPPPLTEPPCAQLPRHGDPIIIDRSVQVVRGALEALPPRANRPAELAASRALCHVLERLSEEAAADAGAMEAEVRGVEAAANDAEHRADELEAALARVSLEGMGGLACCVSAS